MAPALRELTIDGQDKMPAPEKVSSALRKGTGGKNRVHSEGTSGGSAWRNESGPKMETILGRGNSVCKYAEVTKHGVEWDVGRMAHGKSRGVGTPVGKAGGARPGRGAWAWVLALGCGWAAQRTA